MKKTFMMAVLLVSTLCQAAEYKMDTTGAHAFIQFRIKHLGYSWLYGRFDRFEGSFQYDAKKPEQSSALVNIDMASLDTNHAERDKHLRDERFFNVAKFPTASFVGKSFIPAAGGKNAQLNGILTLKGIAKPISIEVEPVGGGPDPWGGVRQGFSGKTQIVLRDFGIDFNLGPASTTAEVMLDIEGVKQ